jgi:hypothetical protein
MQSFKEWVLEITYLNPKSRKSAFKFNNLKRTIIKYYLEEYFGIDIIVLEFETLSI